MKNRYFPSIFPYYSSTDFPEFSYPCYDIAYTEYTDEKNTEERMDSMSFVGMVILTEGIVAFADSKSSCLDELGNMIEQKNRGNVRKVFKNKHFIIVAYNSNQFADSQKKEINIDEWMEENMRKYDHYFDFLHALLDEISKSENNQGRLFSFIIGSKDEDGYFYLDAKIQNNIVSFRNKNREKGRVIAGGNSFYINRISLLDPVPDDLNMAEKWIECRVNALIGEADEIGSYNPVGKPIIVEKF